MQDINNKKGILNINKSGGMTSSDVVCRVRKALNTRAVGHMGTLDPMGEGVLLIGVGKATRLFDYFLGKSKTYTASFVFGAETDTLDREGKITRDGGRIPNRAEVEQILPSFIGKQLQIPPLYSAKKVNGRKAYDLARRGEVFELKPSAIEIYAIKIIDEIDRGFSFEIGCSGGTYIRSICRDIAYKLGTYALMSAITRTVCGEFKLEDAISPEDIATAEGFGLISVERALSGLKRIDLSAELYKPLTNGIKIENKFTDEKSFAVYCADELFGIGETDANGFISLKTYLRD